MRLKSLKKSDNKIYDSRCSYWMMITEWRFYYTQRLCWVRLKNCCFFFVQNKCDSRRVKYIEKTMPQFHVSRHVKLEIEIYFAKCPWFSDTNSAPNQRRLNTSGESVMSTHLHTLYIYLTHIRVPYLCETI